MSPARFATTHWSLIVAARDPRSPEAASALATLCDTYWRPVYGYIRRSGKSTDDAADLTQSFFARVLEKHYFDDADRTRGRFRTFLLTAVRHFLANEHDAAMALKRGGRVRHLSLDADEEERSFVPEPGDPETPEHLYERRWALAVIDAAMARLGARYDTPDRQRLFARLRPLMTGDEPSSYSALSADLGMSEGALRIALYRLRKHFATSLRDVVGETVEDATAIDDELRYLMSIVSR